MKITNSFKPFRGDCLAADFARHRGFARAIQAHEHHERASFPRGSRRRAWLQDRGNELYDLAGGGPGIRSRLDLRHKAGTAVSQKRSPIRTLNPHQIPCWKQETHATAKRLLQISIPFHAQRADEQTSFEKPTQALPVRSPRSIRTPRFPYDELVRREQHV